jgi:hypothetical protein
MVPDQYIETSTRRMFLISVEQLRVNTNILSVKLYLASLLLTLLRHYAVLWSTMKNGSRL